MWQSVYIVASLACLVNSELSSTRSALTPTGESTLSSAHVFISRQAEKCIGHGKFRHGISVAVSIQRGWIALVTRDSRAWLQETKVEQNCGISLFRPERT